MTREREKENERERERERERVKLPLMLSDDRSRPEIAMELGGIQATRLRASVH